MTRKTRLVGSLGFTLVLALAARPLLAPAWAATVSVLNAVPFRTTSGSTLQSTVTIGSATSASPLNVFDGSAARNSFHVLGGHEHRGAVHGVVAKRLRVGVGERPVRNRARLITTRRHGPVVFGRKQESKAESS